MPFSDGQKSAISTGQSVQVGREYDESIATYPDPDGFTPGVAGVVTTVTTFAGSYAGVVTAAAVNSAGEVAYVGGSLVVEERNSDADRFAALEVGDDLTINVARSGATAVNHTGPITTISESSGVFTIGVVFTPVRAVLATTDVIVISSSVMSSKRAVRKFSAQDFMLREQLAQEMFDNERGYGIIARSNRSPVATRNHTVLEQTSRMDFEQILLPLLAGVEGGVTPDWEWGAIGSGDDYSLASDAASVASPGEFFIGTVTSGAVTITIRPLDADLRYFKLIFGSGVEVGHEPATGQLRLYATAAINLTFDVPAAAPAPVSGVYTILATNAALTGTFASTNDVKLEGGAWEWSFGPVATSRPQLETFTFEYAEDDLSDDGEFPRAMHFGYCMSIECSMGTEGVPQMRANFDGRIAQDIDNLTPNLSAEDFPSAGALRTSVYFDDSWADLGNTQVLGQVYNVSWNYTSHFFHQYYDDGREDMDFSVVHVRPRQIAVSADVLVDTDLESLVRQERARKRSDQADDKRRYMRIQWEGARINGITQRLQLDTVGVHADDSLSEYGGERDGNNITRISLMSIFDDAAARDMRVVIRNGLKQFP